MEAKRNSSSSAGIFIVIVLLLSLIALFALPSPRDIKPGPHAVERHGQDALDARAQLKNCTTGMRARMCPKTDRHSASLVFWCETGGSTCPGTYATLGMIEKTTFFRPCWEWRRCR